MLSIIALIFTLPGAILMWIPFLAIVNGVYDGGQSLSAIIGTAIGLPGIVLVLIDILRRGWRKSIYGIVGILALMWPFVATIAIAGFCDLTSACGDLGQPVVDANGRPVQFD